jgi:hypothetical protein
MNEKKFNFNRIEDGNIKLKPELKKKSKKFANIPFNGELLTVLGLALDFISSSPDVKSKFGYRLERFLKPRIQEIQRIIYLEMIDKKNFKIEFSKDSIEDIQNGLSFDNVKIHISNYKKEYKELMELFDSANPEKK